MQRKFSFRRLLNTLFLIVAIAAGTSAHAQQSSPAHSYDVINITLNLRFDWKLQQAKGTAAITFKPQVNNLRQVEFDATNMTFESVKLTSGPALKFETDAAKEKLRLTLDREYQPSDVLTVLIDYHTNGVSQERALGGTYRRGLVFIEPTEDDPARPRQIWSQGQPQYNHYWYPCYDPPDDFATSEVIATVEKPFTVISNGILVETKNNTDGTRTFHWKMDVPHANYLTSIIVGEYATIETSYAGIPIRTNVYPNEVEAGKVTTANTAAMIKLFSELIGIKYPYAKYDQTVARDFGLGMENVSGATFSDLILHDARAGLDHNSEGLLAHELAHQWFGNYVTSRNWKDIWLNEGFAVYFQGIWHEHHLSPDDFYYLDVKPNQDRYFAAWAEGLRRPLVPKEFSNADDLFDAYAYQRGAAVLHMLRNVVGDENWWRSVRRYLDKYAHQPVETDQFRKVIEDTSGQSLSWFFDQWVYRMGHPIFNVSQSYDSSAGTLTVTVKQELDPNLKEPQASFFRAPVEIKIVTKNGERVERALIEPKEVQEFKFKVDSAPRLVSFDPRGVLIKELRFSKTKEELLYQLAQDKDLAGRLWALNQITPRMLDKATKTDEQQEIATVLADALTRDKFWGLRLEAATALENVPGKAAQTALRKAVNDTDARVRARAIASLSSSNDPALASVYEQLLSDQSYAVIREAALALGKTRSPNAYASLEKLVNVPSWRDSIKTAALNGLAELGDTRSKELALQNSDKRVPVPVRAAGIGLLGVVGKGDPRAYPLITTTFQEAFAMQNMQLGLAASEALVSLCDARGLDFLAEISKAVGNDPHGQAFVSQLTDRLRKCVQTSHGSQK